MFFLGGKLRVPTGASRRIVASHERMRPPDYQPEVVSGGERALFIFPGMHLVKGGKVFHIQTSWRYTLGFADLAPTSSFEIDPDGKGQWLAYSVSPTHPVHPRVPLREEGTSVLLPPAGDGRILGRRGRLRRFGRQQTTRLPKRNPIAGKS